MKILVLHPAQKHSFSRALRLNHDAIMQTNESSDEYDNDQPSSKLWGMRDVNL